MTLSEIASEVERLRPGTLPKSMFIVGHRIWTRCAYDGSVEAVVPDDIARAMLIGSIPMSAAGEVVLIRTADAWRLDLLNGSRERWFHDSDHGNDPLLSLFAAFKAACGEVGDA